MHFLRIVVSVTGLLFAFAACDRGPSVPGTQLAIDAAQKAQAEMEAASMDFSRLISVRLQHDGRRLEVVSIAPAVIGEGRVGGEVAKTIFRVDADGGKLVLFSRDVFGAGVVRTEIPLTQLEPKRLFNFPVVQPDGRLRDSAFAVEKIIYPDVR